MGKVIFDSSFLMAVVERPTTWFEDMTQELGRFQPVVLDCVLDEMKRLASGEGKKAKSARVALELAEGFRREPCGGSSPDDEIVSAALAEAAVVATTDKELSRTLKARHVKVVGLSLGRVALR